MQCNRAGADAGANYKFSLNDTAYKMPIIFSRSTLVKYLIFLLFSYGKIHNNFDAINIFKN